MGMVKDAPRTIALIFVLGFPMAAAAHGGGLDGLGCHNDNQRGGYHCHRGPLAGRSFSSKAEALEDTGGEIRRRRAATCSGDCLNGRSARGRCGMSLWFG